MRYSTPFLNASTAARQLGVSIKALRLYEQRGLVTPGRTAAGYRAYDANAMRRAAEVVALRALGLSLAEVAHVLAGDAASLQRALAAREAVLENEIGAKVDTLARVRAMRASLARGEVPAAAELAGLLPQSITAGTAFALPWPWGGEWFELGEIRPLNYIVGPLGSGKTRLAMQIAAALPDAAFLGLDREQATDPDNASRLAADAVLGTRVDRALRWLLGEGATQSTALLTLLLALEGQQPAMLVIDMLEQGLDQATQEALIRYLRQRASSGARPLFLMTRSSAILDLAAIGPDEAIIFCPANHSPPLRVAPYPGAPGFEAVAMCLGSPAVRARTAGTIAWRPPQAA